MNDYYCPVCNQKADECHALLFPSFTMSCASMTLFYFMCVHCRLVGFDRRLTKKQISNWLKGELEISRRKISFWSVYRWAVKELKELIVGVAKRLNMHIVPFRRG